MRHCRDCAHSQYTTLWPWWCRKKMEGVNDFAADDCEHYEHEGVFVYYSSATYAGKKLHKTNACAGAFSVRQESKMRFYHQWIEEHPEWFCKVCFKTELGK